MKLKKKHFKKLKEIAVAINRLDKLIAEIELVHRAKEEFSLIEISQLQKDLGSQKLKTEEEIYAMHRKDVDANFLKEGKAMVAASTDESTYTEGLRKHLVGSTDWRPLEFGGSDFAKTVDGSILSDKSSNGILEVEKGSEIEKFLDPLMVPKIGDVGYFWDGQCIAAVYGKLQLILETFPVKYGVTLNGKDFLYFKNLSKTPPELK